MIRRTYTCSDCGHQFKALQDKGEALLSDCPACAPGRVTHDLEAERAEGEARIASMIEDGIAPGVLGNRSKAIKTAEAMMSEMGMTNLNDSGRQGDVAAKAPSAPHAREIQEMTQAMVEMKAIDDQQANQFAEGAKSFWQGSKKDQPARLQKHIAAAPSASAMARREGIDPIALFHEAGKKGHLKRKPQIAAAVRG